MYAKIEPVTYRTGQASCLVVRGISVQLNERATVEWSLMSDPESGSKRDFESGGVQMNGEEYTAWGNDDSYVYSWLSEKLNVTIETMEPGNYWEVQAPLV